MQEFQCPTQVFQVQPRFSNAREPTSTYSSRYIQIEKFTLACEIFWTNFLTIPVQLVYVKEFVELSTFVNAFLSYVVSFFFPLFSGIIIHRMQDGTLGTMEVSNKISFMKSREILSCQDTYSYLNSAQINEREGGYLSVRTTITTYIYKLILS